MNTAKSIIRLAVLVALCALGLFLIFDPEKSDLPMLAYCVKVFFDKAIGILCFIAAGLLYNKWCATDRWLKKYESWIKEAEEAQL